MCCSLLMSWNESVHHLPRIPSAAASKLPLAIIDAGYDANENSTINQSVNQRMNEWMNQWINQSINQRMNEWINQSINQSNQKKKNLFSTNSNKNWHITNNFKLWMATMQKGQRPSRTYKLFVSIQLLLPNQINHNYYIVVCTVLFCDWLSAGTILQQRLTVKNNN